MKQRSQGRRQRTSLDKDRRSQGQRTAQGEIPGNPGNLQALARVLICMRCKTFIQYSTHTHPQETNDRAFLFVYMLSQTQPNTFRLDKHNCLTVVVQVGLQY